nr:MAG TPA: hypothetical protein [Microviridae sp.]
MKNKKKKKRRREAGRTPEQMRDPYVGRSRLLARRFADPLPRPPRQSVTSIINRQIEDLRHDNSPYLDNNGIRTYRDTRGQIAATIWVPVRKFDVQGKELSPQMRHVFRDPSRAMVCVRRRSRRAVLFAMRKTGRSGARRNRKAVWSDKSRIVCRKGR